MFGRYLGGLFSKLKVTNNIYVDSPFRNHITPLVKKVIVYPFSKISKFTPISFPKILENGVEVSYEFQTHFTNFKLFLVNNSEIIKDYLSNSVFKYSNFNLSLKVGLEEQTNIKASFKNGCLESYTVENTRVKDSSCYSKPTDKSNFSNKCILPLNSNSLSYLWDFSAKPPMGSNDLTVFMNNSNYRDNFEYTPIYNDSMGHSYDDLANYQNNDSVSTFDNYETTNSNLNENNLSYNESPNYGTDLGFIYPLFEGSNINGNDLSYSEYTDYDITNMGENLNEIFEDQGCTKRTRTDSEEGDTSKRARADSEEADTAQNSEKALIDTAQKVDKGKKRAITPLSLPEKPITSDQPTESEYESEENYMRDMEQAKLNSLKEQTGAGESSKQTEHSVLELESESEDIIDTTSINNKKLELSNITSIKVKIHEYNIRFSTKDVLVKIDYDSEILKIEQDTYLDAILYKARNAIVKEYYYLSEKLELEDFLEDITLNNIIFNQDNCMEFTERFVMKYLKPDFTSDCKIDILKPLFSTKYFKFNRYFELITNISGLPKDPKTGNFEYNKYMLSSSQAFKNKYVVPHLNKSSRSYLSQYPEKISRCLGQEGNFFILLHGETVYFYPVIHEECLYSPHANEYIAGLLQSYRDVHTNKVLSKHGYKKNDHSARKINNMYINDKDSKHILNKIVRVKPIHKDDHLGYIDVKEDLIKALYNNRNVRIIPQANTQPIAFFDLDKNLHHKFLNMAQAGKTLNYKPGDISNAKKNKKLLDKK